YLYIENNYNIKKGKEQYFFNAKKILSHHIYVYISSYYLVKLTLLYQYFYLIFYNQCTHLFFYNLILNKKNELSCLQIENKNVYFISSKMLYKCNTFIFIFNLKG
ncbi:hypothetical protein CUM73_07160, partial [Enterococcus faecalis]